MDSIKQRLAIASSLLLGLNPLASNAAEEPWIVDLGVMNYLEQDRNVGLEFIANASRARDNGGAISLGAELDIITGATPNGASTSNAPQTFTQASGADIYQVQAYELPADDTHMDTRMAVTWGLNEPFGDQISADFNSRLSMEFDFVSLSAGTLWAFDLNQNNTTLIAGANLEADVIHPIGNTPIPFFTMRPPGFRQPRLGARESRHARELTLGWNQVLDQNSLFQIRLTRSHFYGYLTDPYKILSVVESSDPATLGETQRYIYEKRPKDRNSNATYLAYKRAFDSGILDLAYRRINDTWQTDSNTVDLAYRWHLAERHFIRPSLRWYEQDAAYFYRHSLPDGSQLPEYASADLRLGQFTATTLGIEYGRDLDLDRKHSIALEYYSQRGESSPADAIGLQQQQDLFPNLRSLIIKYVYSLLW